MEVLLQKAFLEQDLATSKNEELLNATAGATLKKGFFFKQIFLNNWIGIITSLGVIIVSIVGIYAAFRTESKYSPTAFRYELPKVDIAHEMSELPTQSVKLLKGNITSAKVKKRQTKNYTPKPIIKTEKKVYSPEKVAFDIPILSEDAKKRHLKTKEKYLKAIMKFDKKKVSRVKTTNHQSLQKGNNPPSSFIIWTTEISNSEYRLFLNDLIFQNRKTEYVTAVIDSSEWTRSFKRSFFEPMKNMYGWHPAYDDYPVVNVSIEGARLFCKWLSEEITGTFQDKEILEVRFPNEQEWEYAASSGRKSNLYPWGGPFVKNDKGCYLANYKPGVDVKNPCSDREKTMDDVVLNDELKNNSFSADGGLITVKVDSYNPNSLGLYNMSGNVSEMVFNEKSGKVGVKGGSWESDKEELKIKAPLQREGEDLVHPTIGFRPIIVYKDRNELGRAYQEVILDPSLSEQQIKENNKRKNKMIQQIVNVDQDYYTSLSGSRFSLNEKSGSVKSKSIIAKKHEVSMIEYKTFLFDLIRQERFEEYHKVKPIDEALGVDSSFYNSYMHNYFYRPAFDDYPVLNITTEGAELFCKWLSAEVKNFAKQNKNQLFRSVRIPTYDEWMYLATKTAEVDDTITDRLGKDALKIKLMNIESVSDSGRKNYDGAVFTNRVNSYIPNSVGLYNMVGNVAEMITYKDGTYGSKGGSWDSNVNELDLYREDSTKGNLQPNAMTGFRFVMDWGSALGSTEFSTPALRPQLTEKQKKETAKKKAKMLSSLFKYNKDKHTLLLVGNMESNGNVTKLADFQIGKHEVTNKEYRTFLFDLIIQGRYSEFEIAKPDQKLWFDFIKEGGDNLSKLYFINEAYDDFPVVNITAKGAELFCTWLFAEAKKVDFKNRTKSFKGIRLPTGDEWVAVASDYGKFKKYPWPGNEIYSKDKRGNLALKAVFAAEKGKPSIMFRTVIEGAERMNQVFPVNKALRTPFDVYNIVGNVAEMVKYKDGSYGSKGGSWNSTAEEIEIYAPDKTKDNLQAGPTLGFRYVIEWNFIRKDEDQLIGVKGK